jgi:hypothetical protein
MSVRKLTVEDVRLSGFRVAAAPVWAYSREDFHYEPIPEVWADLLAELKRRARQVYRQAKREHARQMEKHNDLQERLKGVNQLTEGERLRISFGWDPFKPPPAPTMPEVGGMKRVYGWSPYHCRQCDRPYLTMVGKGRGPSYCSLRCWKAARKDRPRPSRAKKRTERACDQCGRPFLPKRSDARTCSIRCRVAAHRAVRHATEEK